MRLNNLVKKFFAAGLAAILMMANADVSFADPGPFTYSPIPGTTTVFTKDLEMKADANVPNVTFNFSIAPGTAIAATAATAAVSPGPAGAAIGSAVFMNTDETALKADDNTKKTASKTVTVDLTGVTFTEPGIYRYVITESAAGVSGVTNDTTAARTLDVYVTDSGSALTVSGYVLLSGNEAPAPSIGDAGGSAGSYGIKSTGYVNTYDTYNLTVSKNVSGNQASRDKYFAITVAITGANNGTRYDVDVTTNAEANPGRTPSTTYESMTNPASLEAADGSVTQTFYLQHGQSIVIKGLAAGTLYTVTEDPEDYKSSAPDGISSDEAGITDNVTAAFINTKDGTIPTGVILDSAPFILLIVLAAAALAFTAAGKKSR